MSRLRSFPPLIVINVFGTMTRQLHEMDRWTCVEMKQAEHVRQQTVH